MSEQVPPIVNEPDPQVSIPDEVEYLKEAMRQLEERENPHEKVKY